MCAHKRGRAPKDSASCKCYVSALVREDEREHVAILVGQNVESHGQRNGVASVLPGQLEAGLRSSLVPDGMCLDDVVALGLVWNGTLDTISLGEVTAIQVHNLSGCLLCVVINNVSSLLGCFSHSNFGAALSNSSGDLGSQIVISLKDLNSGGASSSRNGQLASLGAGDLLALQEVCGGTQVVASMALSFATNLLQMS